MASSNRRSFSFSSSRRKSAARFREKKFSRTSFRQNASMVQISAPLSRDSWRFALAFPGSAAKIWRSRTERRERISAAAALVKVTISSRSMSTGCPGSVIHLLTRSISTAVLPLPAAALTKILPPRASIASCWASVHLGMTLPLLFQFCQHSAVCLVVIGTRGYALFERAD